LARLMSGVASLRRTRAPTLRSESRLQPVGATPSNQPGPQSKRRPASDAFPPEGGTPYLHHRNRP